MSFDVQKLKFLYHLLILCDVLGATLTPILNADNQGASLYAKNPVSQQQSKHINVRVPG